MAVVKKLGFTLVLYSLIRRGNTEVNRLLRWFLFLCCFLPGIVSAEKEADPLMDALVSTFKITNKDSTATCFIVSRLATSGSNQQELILVTAAHVLEKMSGDECHIVLRKKDADGVYSKVEVPVVIRANEQPLWVKHPDVDVAVMRLNLPAECSIAALDFEQLLGKEKSKNASLRIADEVCLLTYPAQLEASSAGFPILRRGTVASFPLLPIDNNKTFLVDYHSFGGDSGGPVMIRGNQAEEGPFIVGLVIGKQRETTKMISEIEERTVHRSLGLGIVVHAAFIRQAIALLPE